MVNVPHTFISSLIESEMPLDVIWEYLQNKIWEPETNIVSYFNKNEKKASDFERFIRDVYFEVYDEIVNEAMKGRPKLKEMMEQDAYTLAICDGMSIREANLLVNELENNGFIIDEYTYEISHLPSETLSFTQDVLGVSAPSALRTSSAWRERCIYIEDLTTDYPIPSSDRVLLFSRFPDREFDNVSSKIGDSLKEIYGKTSDVLIKYLKMMESEKIIITSDHGYCTKHPNATWKVPTVEKEIYQEVFGLARFKKRSEIFGDMESKVKEVEEKTGRLKTVNGYVLTNGRYIWPVKGDQKKIYHGGISFMENFVPLIVASKVDN